MSRFSSNQTEDFLHPDVYLNHLRSFEAQQVEISRNIVLSVLGVSLKPFFLVLVPLKVIRPRFGIYLFISRMI